MHERKRLMADRADCFLVLPGGYGTLDETFEMVTWLQLGLQRKPLALVNVSGYFDPLLRWVQHAIGCGFVRQDQARLLPAADTAEAALALLESRAREASCQASDAT
jgi:cytokinin riboside 5'-monophosphate phosphoribohydrolase